MSLVDVWKLRLHWRLYGDWKITREDLMEEEDGQPQWKNEQKLTGWEDSSQ